MLIVYIDLDLLEGIIVLDMFFRFSLGGILIVIFGIMGYLDTIND